MTARARHWLRLVAINLVVFLGIVFGAELLWRLSFPHSSAEAEFIQASLAYLEPCATTERRADGVWIVGDEQPERNAFALPLQPTPDVIRIAIVGESSGSMLAFKMGEVLGQSPARERFQIINCAAPGSGLEHVERRAREVLTYQPNVLVVIFGHNVDFRYPMDEAALRSSSWRQSSALVSALVAWLSPPPSPATTPLNERLQQFDSWLQELSAAARQQGTQLVLTTMTPNLWAVPRSTWQAQTDPQFLAARFDYAAGQQARAVDALTTLVQNRDEALWHFVLGTWLARAGDSAAARRHLRRALDADGRPPDSNGAPVGRDRAPSAINDIVRRMAHENDLPLRDTEHDMERSAHDGLPGWDVMQDHCHLQAALLLREAAIVLDLTQELSDVPADRRVELVRPASDTKPGLTKILELSTSAPRTSGAPILGVALAVERWLRDDPVASRATIQTFLSGSGYAAAPDPAGAGIALAGIAEGYWLAGYPDDALAINALARQQRGTEPWVQLGLFSVQRGDLAGARQAFGQALERDPNRADAAFFLDRLDHRG